MKPILALLLALLALTTQAQKMAVPYYSAGQIKFYDVATTPATLLGTLTTTVSGTTYKPNGAVFYSTDMLVPYDEPTSDGFLHYKGVQVSGGTVTYASVVKVTTSTVTTEIVVDASGNVYVGCGFGGLRGVKKFIRDGSGNYSSSSNLTMPAVTNSQWYSGIGGLALDASGNLFATDLSDSRILKWANGTGTPSEFKCTSGCSSFVNTAGQSVSLFAYPEGLVFDASGNLWVGNNNDFTTVNASGGSLLKLNASLVSGAGGSITSSNVTIYSTSAAKFGGLGKVGTDYFVNDQGNSKVWKLNTSTGGLTDVGISATYPGNGQMVNVPAAVFPGSGGGVTATGSISVTSTFQTNNPRTRTFTYRLPKAAPDCNLPLMIVLHGDGGTGAGIMNGTGFNALGDAQNFITVYPNSGTVDGSVQWNKFADGVAGSGDNGNDANAPDDVQFIADLIDYFHKTFGINKAKVYVTGHSGGGFMAYFLAIANQTKSKIAGIAPVSASLWGDDNYLNTQFGASAFVAKPVLHIHATTDNSVNFPDLSGWVWPESSFGSATCGNSTKTTTAVTAEIDKHTFCNNPNPVVLIGLKRAGLGHNWPTTANSGYNTETEIWNFLSPYSKAQTAIQPSIAPLSTTITAGNTVALTASGCGTLTYKWSTNQTGSSITVSPSVSTTYTVGCYTDNNCLSGNLSTVARVTVSSGPAVNPPTISANPTFVCFGGSSVLSSTGCTSGTVTWSTGQTGTSITVTGLSTTSDYTATCTQNGITSDNSNTVTVQVDPNPQPSPPTLSSTAPGSVAPGTSVTLTASGCPAPAVVTWSNSLGTGLTKVVAPSQSTTYTATCTYAPCVSSPGMVVVTVGGTPTVDEHIKTDQFGYLPSAQKIAVISSPDPAINQYNKTSSFTPSNSYQLRRVSDDISVFSGSPVSWKSGATHTQSGDKVWWFDFSSVTTPGSYYVFDVGNNKRSYPFAISTSVYDTPAKQALAALGMQRCGVARFGQLGSKTWSDNACHIGNLQDTHCRDVSDPTNTSKERDMSGGWHDAGDFNKYSLYASEALHNLLKAYEENPSAWTALSGSLPAPLLEAKYELDWLLKMQDTDGGIRCKISIKGYGASSPPSTDTRQRFYGGKSTLTTLAVSSVLAHAASIFSNFASTTLYSNTLKTAAQNAWNWAIANPNVIFDNTPFLVDGGGSYNPDDGIYSDASNNYYRSISYKTVAAAYLFNVYGSTAGATYKTTFESLYASTNQMTWSAGSDTYFPDWQVVLDALLTYASNAGATTSHATAIQNKFTSLLTTSTKLLPAYTNSTDAYRAYLNYYTWNSNQQKAQAGIQMQLLKASNLSPANNTALQNASLGYMNYLHGLNPNAKCYLSQMNTLGADNSQNEIYHGWFWDGTVYDNALTSSVGPFPGFLIGGPNQDYSGAVNPPSGQPAQKSYKDWNTDYPEASYEITEIGIYTQAAYIRLVSRFMSSGCSLPAGTAISAQSGDWSTPGTWVCGQVPTTTSSVQVKAGHVVTVNSTVQAKDILFENGGKIQLLTTQGRVVLNP